MNAEDRGELATSLRVIRAERRLTQGQLAHLAGLSINTIGRIESTDLPVYKQTVQALEGALNEELLER
jgi:DNA-binding XRE family transcriptional regulator